MPRDGSGNYSLPSGNPVVTNTIISSGGWANPTMSDIASALTQSLSRDGQTTPTADLSMGNFKLRNLANALARTDAVPAGQIQDGGLTTLSSVTGTDTITAASAPAITAYAAGQCFDLIAAGANTTNAVTLNINALGAKAVMKMGFSGLVQIAPGDFQTGQSVRIRYDGTQFQVISPIPQTSAYSFRNRFINPRFDFWQRGQSFSVPALGAYTSDQWIAACGSAGVATISAVGTTVGDPLAAGRLALQFAQTTLAVTAPFLAQRIEGVRTLASKTVTVSITGFAASGTIVVTPFAIQSFGTGGSTQVQTNFPTVTLTTTEQTFTASVALPSITGKTIGVNNDDYLLVGFNFPISATFTATIISAQCEEGGTATPFEVRPYATELNLCQRYYWRGLPCLGINFGSYAASAGFSMPVKFPATMRTTPALSTGTLSGGAYSQCTLVGVQLANTDGCRLLLQGTTTATNANVAYTSGVHYIEADATL